MDASASDTGFSLGEEIAHSVTHGVGAVLSVVGLAVLVVFSTLRGDAVHVAGCSVFGASLIALYTASTLYHGVRLPRLRRWLRRLDYSSIYLLIAGSYTPFALVKLGGLTGWMLLAVLWSLAAVGVLLTLTLFHRIRRISLVVYLLMGWSAVFVAEPFFRSLEPGALALVLAGGLAYTGGVGSYLWKRLPYHHAVWHVFVLAGSACHFFAVLFYVIPAEVAS